MVGDSSLYLTNITAVAADISLSRHRVNALSKVVTYPANASWDSTHEENVRTQVRHGVGNVGIILESSKAR